MLISRRGIWFFKAVGIGVGFLALAVLCLGYGLARIYIVVECFIALFNSVPGVFEVPAWSTYLLHIN